MSEPKILAEGLRFPEGPVVLPDGNLLVVEIARGTLTRVRQDGGHSVVAELGGGPNGAAIGPDGKVYVCNNGGFTWHEVMGLLFPGDAPAEYRGGSIQRVDLATGHVETLYTHANGTPLRGPNDIVFDDAGGFWFTDHGKTTERARDRTGVFYAKADGSFIEEVLFPMENPNGVGLAPDGRTLYVAETYTCKLWAFDLAGPGKVIPQPGLLPHGGRFLASPAGFKFFDSLAVDAEGYVCVATIGESGISVVDPKTGAIDLVAMPDPMTTNICFGGADMRTAFITLSGTGRIATMTWPRPGLRLAGQR